MDSKKSPVIAIIGGLSAGPSAAAKARRMSEDARILLFEKTDQISYATCGIPYALSGKIQDREKLLVVKPALLEKRFGVEMHLEEPVVDVDPEAHLIHTTKGTYQYDKLVFATGGTAILPPIEGLEHTDQWAHAKTMEDFDKLMQAGVMSDTQHVTVIGAGLIGLETAENLVKADKMVSVIELGAHVLGPWEEKFARMAEGVLQAHDIDVRTRTSVKAASNLPNGRLLLTLSDGKTLETDFLVIGISVLPNTQMLTAKGAAHLPNGALIVNERMETSLPDIYAAGDCASIPNLLTGKAGWYPMGTHSNKGGRAAGANAVGGDITFKGAYGTAIMKLFEYTIGRTGMGPRQLKAEGIPFESTFVIASSTPSFYPDPKDIFVEIYYHPDTKVVLGAELFGEKGVDKRVDVLATAIYARLTTEDLTNLDLAYAPPFSPAKDPVVVAGYVASNTTLGLYTDNTVTEAAAHFAQPTADQLLDVRNPNELALQGKVAGAVNIPLDQLRERLSELDASRPVWVYCAKGLRGYLASLILAHHGFGQVHNIAGGFTAWKKVGLAVEKV